MLCFGRRRQRFDVVAQAFLVLPDLGHFFIDSLDSGFRRGHAALEIDDLFQRRTRRRVDVIARDEQFKIRTRKVDQRVRVHQRASLSHRQLNFFVRPQRNAKAIVTRGLVVGLRRFIRERPILAHRMLNQNHARFVRLIRQDIRLLGGLIIVSLKDPVDGAHQERGRAVFFYPHVDQSTEIEGEGDQSLFGGLQTLHQSFAGIGVAIDHRQRPAIQRQRRSVLEQHSPHRSIASIAFVVDRDALAFHARLQDRNQRRAIARDRDRLIDVVFEKVADFAAGGGGFNARVGASDGVAERGTIERAAAVKAIEGVVVRATEIPTIRRKPSPHALARGIYDFRTCRDRDSF